MSSTLVAAANENLRRTGELLADHSPDGATRRFGTVVAVTADAPVPNFNRVLVTDPPRDENLAAAVSWLADRDVPFWVTATNSAVEAVETLDAEIELTPAGEAPGMALASLEDVPPDESVADVAEVTDDADLADFVSVFEDVFEFPRAAIRQMTAPSLLGDDAIRLFVGRADGEPVACGQLVRSDDVAGVYSIGVVESFRRRGLGEATTWAVLRAGRADGCEVGVLQSTEMGVPLYEQMGFETVVTYHHFEPVR